MSMRAGQFDRTITIDRATNSTGDDGTVVQTWATVFTLRARRLANAASDKIATEGSSTVTTEAFITRFIDGVTLEDRLSFESIAYTIKDISEIGRRRGLQFKVERVG